MAKLNLAAKLKQSIDNVKRFSSHPLQNEDNNTKLNYLRVLSLMIYADQTCHEEEKAYFGSLFRTLNPEGATLEDLLAFAEHPDFSDVEAITTTLREQEQTGIALLMDLLMLAAVDSEIKDEEKALIGACRGFLGWDNEIYNGWFTCCQTIATDEKSEAFKKMLQMIPEECVGHVLAHRGLSQAEIQRTWSTWDKELLRQSLQGKLPAFSLESLLALAPQESMAVRVKEALEGTAFFKTHPLKEARLEDKMNYLKVLSLVMVADEKVVPEEQAYFGAVTRTLVGSDMLQGLLDWANNPDLSEIARMTETMPQDDQYKVCLILDACMLAYTDSILHEDEVDLIGQFRSIVGWDHEKFKYIYNLGKAISIIPEGLNLYALCKHFPAGYTLHILEYRGIKITPSDCDLQLGIELEEIRNMKYGSVVNANRISKYPITVRQFHPFLDYLRYIYDLNVSSNILETESGEQLINLRINGFTRCKNGGIQFKNENENNPVCSISPLAANLYCDWLTLSTEKKYQIPIVKGDKDKDISLFTNTRGFFISHGSKICVFPFKTQDHVRLSNLKKLDNNKISHMAELYVVETKSQANKPQTDLLNMLKSAQTQRKN
ncbi:TerB family tellurite resistance protein [Desulfoluna sp.]|uniref:TerB family tellurite resistance protein n=1 Tax=Desulfoluna sp. TaxID=2045199 RepID=UPI00260EC631|nr:TerB family tellurite resistance protein [Desulfoluna sp.]